MDVEGSSGHLLECTNPLGEAGVLSLLHQKLQGLQGMASVVQGSHGLPVPALQREVLENIRTPLRLTASSSFLQSSQPRGPSRVEKRVLGV